MPRGKSLSTEIVLDKAFEMARRDGIDGVSYNGLARALDIRPQSLYRYVPDVKALRVALLGGFLNELVDSISRATEGLPPKEALCAFAVAIYDECHACPCYYEAFDLMHSHSLIPELREPLTRLVSLVQRPVSQVVDDPAEAGRYTQLIMAAILGYAQMSKTEFIVESLADNREAYVRSVEEFIQNIVLS